MLLFKNVNGGLLGFYLFASANIIIILIKSVLDFFLSGRFYNLQEVNDGDTNARKYSE